MGKKLEGKNALILGGTSGMGLASAKLFLAEGANVIITGRNRQTLDAAAQELGENVAAYQADIADHEATRTAIESGVARFGKLDVFYQVAGTGAFLPFAGADAEHYEHMFDVDLLGPIVATLSAREYLNDGASLIYTTTTVSTRAVPTMTAYAAAKAGLAHFARALALELAERNIRVNVLSPGATDTPIFDKAGLPQEQVEGTKQFFAMVTPLKRLGSPDDIARAALFLASDDSSQITGITLDVDGGLNQSWHLMPQG